MDEPSKEPNPPADPERPATGESPLAFPAEAPLTAGESAAQPGPDVRPGDALQAFPVEAPRPAGESAAQAEPDVRSGDATLAFPAELQPAGESTAQAEPDVRSGDALQAFPVESLGSTAGESAQVEPHRARPVVAPVEAPRPAGESTAQAEPGVAQPRDALLAFPVEAPRPAAGEPFAPGESGTVRPESGLPSFPVEAPQPTAEELFAPVEPDVVRPEDGLLAFQPEPPRPAGASSAPVEPDVVGSSAAPLAFPVEAPRPAQPLLTRQPLPPDGDRTPPTEPVPVAILPGMPANPPRPAPAEPQPIATPPEPAAGPPRALVPVLVAFGALLVLGACFLPLFRVEQHVTAQQTFFTPKLIFTESAWSSQVSAEGNDAVEQPAAPVGIPLVIAVVVLGAAAVFGFSRWGRLGHRLAVIGASFAAGIAFTIGMSGLVWTSGLGDDGLDVSLGLGLWSLIAGIVVVVVAVVLGYLPARAPDDWSDPALAYADTPTPPAGFVLPTIEDADGVAITVLPPEPPEPPEPPGR